MVAPINTWASTNSERVHNGKSYCVGIVDTRTSRLLTLGVVFLLEPAASHPAGNFQYAHQVWSSVWAAVAGLLGVLFAIRR